MYPSLLDKIIGKLSLIQADAVTMSAVGQAGADYATMCLQMIAAAIDGAENMSHCLCLECKRVAVDYLPPSAPLLGAALDDDAADALLRR